MIMKIMDILPPRVTCQGIKYPWSIWTLEQKTRRTGLSRSLISPSCPGAATQSLGSTNQHCPHTSSPKSWTTVCNPVTPSLCWLQWSLARGACPVGSPSIQHPDLVEPLPSHGLRWSKTKPAYLKDSKLTLQWMINQTSKISWSPPSCAQAQNIAEIIVDSRVDGEWNPTSILDHSGEKSHNDNLNYVLSSWI